MERESSDMSRILPFLMPSKKLPRMADASQLCQMLQETCIAELVHALLCVAGVGAVFIWRGIGGWLFFILYAFGNLPFIIIQRYNRPKLMRLLQLVGDREKNKIR